MFIFFSAKQVTFFLIFLSALEIGQLFGEQDVSDSTWRDGLVSRSFKQFAQQRDAEADSLIVFDGPVDCSWIENFNTVLDEHKILCLGPS